MGSFASLSLNAPISSLTQQANLPMLHTLKQHLMNSSPVHLRFHDRDDHPLSVQAF